MRGRRRRPRLPCRHGRKAAMALRASRAHRVPMPASVSAHYAALVAAGEIERDAAQAALVARLDRLNERLASYRLARKSSSLGWLFAKRENEQAPLRGVYIHGEVGRGKTMLM